MRPREEVVNEKASERTETRFFNGKTFVRSGDVRVCTLLRKKYSSREKLRTCGFACFPLFSLLAFASVRLSTMEDASFCAVTVANKRRRLYRLVVFLARRSTAKNGERISQRKGKFDE